jgi:hypothetical protein
VSAGGQKRKLLLSPRASRAAVEVGGQADGAVAVLDADGGLGQVVVLQVQVLDHDVTALVQDHLEGIHPPRGEGGHIVLHDDASHWLGSE